MNVTTNFDVNRGYAVRVANQRARAQSFVTKLSHDVLGGAAFSWRRDHLYANPTPVKELMKDGCWMVPAEERPVSPEIKRIAERIRARR